jgi:ribonuclease-3
LPSTSPRSCNNSNSNSNNSSNNNNSNNSNDDDHKRPPSPAYNPRNKLIQAADVEAFVGRHVPGCHIDNIDVYRCALTHPSYCTRPGPQDAAAAAAAGCVPLQSESYERLEFLGDAVLNLVVAGYLFQRYPRENEGFMTRMRTKLVNGATLADLCGRCTPLPEFVMLSKQVDDAVDPLSPLPASTGKKVRYKKEAGGRANKKVLEDAFEAFLGALYLEQGFEVARTWLVGFFEDNVDFAHLVAHQNNAKDVLNRYMLSHHGAMPKYEDVPPTSTDAKRSGNIASRIRNKQGTVVATGFGANRREAEDAAARSALLYFGASKAESI